MPSKHQIAVSEATNILEGFVSSRDIPIEPALTDSATWVEGAKDVLRSRQLGILMAFSDDTLREIAEGRIDMGQLFIQAVEAKTMPSSCPPIKPSHRRAVETVLDSLAGPCRKSAISQAIYPLTVPRSHEVAGQLAGKLLRELAGAGRVQRHGHQHWVKVISERTLRSGRRVPELPSVIDLALTTRCPTKWLSIDLETGELWAG